MGAPAGMDWSWATATGGALSARQRRQCLAPLLRGVVAYTATRANLARGRRGAGRLDLDALRWPDSALARDAEEEARATLSPALLEHSYRTYLFGLALAALDGVRVEEELVYVASLLHDLTLGAPVPGRCFAVVGGERAERFCRARGAQPDWAAGVGAAIGGHVTPGASEDLREPAGFVAAGALLDVAGTRLDETDPAWLEEVVRRHPRHHFKREVWAAWRSDCVAVPEGRAAWLRRYGALGLLVRAAPFAE